MINAILIAAMLLGVILAALFSGAETGIYQLSRLRLRLGVQSGKLSFVILSKILRDSPSLLISILIATNLSYYIITSIVTYMLLSKLQAEHTAKFLATVLTAPVLFVFADVIPKNVFFYRADSLMPRISPILLIFYKAFSWLQIVPAMKFVSAVLAKAAGARSAVKTLAAARQSYIKVMLQETYEEGFLSRIQTDLLGRLEGVSHLSIKSVMTPIGKTRLANKICDKSGLLNILKKHPFTRLPVYEQTPADILGFVNIYDCLNQADDFRDLTAFIKPIPTLDAETIVIEAINKMQTENLKIVLVTKGGHGHIGRPVGILTMKDLVEELVGELAEW